MKSQTTSKGKNYDNVLANRIRAAAICFEAKCFGIMCAGHFSQENLETLLSILAPNDKHNREVFAYALQNSSRAASMILDPTGMPVNTWTMSKNGEKREVEMLQNEEGLLFADLNLKDCIEGKQYHDLLGGYQRLDIFSLRVNRTRRRPVTYEVGDQRDSSERQPGQPPTPFGLKKAPLHIQQAARLGVELDEDE